MCGLVLCARPCFSHPADGALRVTRPGIPVLSCPFCTLLGVDGRKRVCVLRTRGWVRAGTRFSGRHVATSLFTDWPADP